MPASKAQQKAVNKYMKENYDRFLTTFRPKGRLDIIKAHAAAYGESANAFINRAIDQAMERDGDGAGVGTPARITTGQIPETGTHEATPTVGGTLPLPPAVLEDIRRMAEAEGESVADFVSRAASAYALRDDAEAAQEGQEGPSGDGVVSLPPETMEAAQRAAEAAREALPDFVARAVAMQAQMDKSRRERIAAAEAARARPQPQANVATLPAVGVPVPPDRIEQAVKDNMSGICSLINEGERRAGNKGRSKQSSSAEYTLRALFEAGYTVEEVRGAAEKAAQEGYTGSWYGFPKYCAKLYGRRWRDPR